VRDYFLIPRGVCHPRGFVTVGIHQPKSLVFFFAGSFLRQEGQTQKSVKSFGRGRFIVIAHKRERERGKGVRVQKNSHLGDERLPPPGAITACSSCVGLITTIIIMARSHPILL